MRIILEGISGSPPGPRYGWSTTGGAPLHGRIRRIRHAVTPRHSYRIVKRVQLPRLCHVSMLCTHLCSHSEVEGTSITASQITSAPHAINGLKGKIYHILRTAALPEHMPRQASRHTAGAPVLSRGQVLERTFTLRVFDVPHGLVEVFGETLGGHDPRADDGGQDDRKVRSRGGERADAHDERLPSQVKSHSYFKL